MEKGIQYIYGPVDPYKNGGGGQGQWGKGSGARAVGQGQWASAVSNALLQAHFFDCKKSSLALERKHCIYVKVVKMGQVFEISQE